jgi:sec-independent protein translocase protein TatB
MFDIGFAELLVIAAVALVVLGPEKLPTAVRTLGLWVGRAKRTIGGIQREISEELRMEELRRTSAIEKEKLDKELNEMRQPFSEASNDIKTTAVSTTSSNRSSDTSSEQSDKPNG